MDCATCRQDLASRFKCLVCGAEFCSPCVKEHRKSRCWPAGPRPPGPSTSRSMSADVQPHSKPNLLKPPAGPAISGALRLASREAAAHRRYLLAE